ncbi:Imm3 family immunity protein [Paenibacillus guangzhouensis]|uniref:Imm3 family immunity protein n=1 Tax=Paenibacillus guangzhouensis TaxID=1473112 RepID=UPI001266BF6B
MRAKRRVVVFYPLYYPNNPIIQAAAVQNPAPSTDKTFVGRIEGIIKRLSMFNPLDAEAELSQEEIKDLERRINAVIEGLKNAEVDYNPTAE